MVEEAKTQWTNAKPERHRDQKKVKEKGKMRNVNRKQDKKKYLARGGRMWMC